MCIAMRTAICLILLLLAACSGGATPAPLVLTLEPQNDSGVTGSVTLTAAGDGRTLIEISAVPNGHPDMPVHVHPGTCAEPVPQPMFPLENVLDGVSTTQIPISFEELRAETAYVNLHHSNDEMRTSVACVDLN
jgi:hypothetical protein